MGTLLTTREGQGVDVAMGAALRVIILSGAADGQEVPQGARTVEREDYGVLLGRCWLRGWS